MQTAMRAASAPSPLLPPLALPARAMNACSCTLLAAALLLLGACRAQPASDDELAAAQAAESVPATSATERSERTTLSPTAPRPELRQRTSPPPHNDALRSAERVERTPEETAEAERRLRAAFEEGSGSTVLREVRTSDQIRPLPRTPSGASPVVIPARVPAPRVDPRQTLALPSSIVLEGPAQRIAPAPPSSGTGR
jgi:hypothetical protein